MIGLSHFTEALFRYTGAVVESREEGGFEALLSEQAARILEVPEYVRLHFFSTEGRKEEEGILLSYDSELFKKMSDLLGQEGRFTVVHFPPAPLKLEKIAMRLSEKVILQNAVFDLTRKEELPGSYLLAYFKYTARSDDRQEGIFAAMINERNLSMIPGPDSLRDLFDGVAEGPMEESDKKGGKDDPIVSPHVLNALFSARKEIVINVLAEFIKSLERRLTRDIVRVQDYYQTLIEEVERIAAKKAALGEGGSNGPAKREAIEMELKWKIQDLIGKYRLTLQMEPISLIRIETKMPIFWLDIKRRKARRAFPLTYNPILKAIDPLPCEGCYHPKRVSFVCDDHLHLICPACFVACRKCGKEICRACQPTGCLKCQTAMRSN